MFSFVAISWIWSSQLRLSSILTPRCSIELEGQSLFLLSWILFGYSKFFFLYWKITSSVFLTSSEILSIRFFVARLIYLLNLLTDLLKGRRTVSSSKWWTLQNFKAWFVYIINLYQDQIWVMVWTLRDTIFYWSLI